MSSPSRQLAAIMFADIVGYTAMMQKDEQQALSLLHRFKSLVEELAENHQGRIVQYYGDGCLLTFNSSAHSVQCALALQKVFNQSDPIPVRIGLHLGEVVFQDGNVFGDGVNIASRIESMAIPGAVLMSKTIRDQIKNKHQHQVQSLGHFEFKNVEEPMEVYALTTDGLPVPDATRVTGKFKDQTPFGIFIVGFLTRNYWSPVTNSMEEPTEIKTELVKSLAVLPLINLNQDADLEYFSNGVTQEIIDELAKINDIAVSAFSSTFIYKDRPKPHAEIAKELNVNYLISGSSRIFGDSVKLSIEMFDPNSNQRIWNGTFNEILDNAPVLQASIAREVANNLNIQLSTDESESLDKLKTESGDAFRLFLRAKSEVSKLSLEGLTNSLVYLKEALEIDPNYAQAHTLFAWTILLQTSSLINGGQPSTAEVVAQAKPHIERALELDPTSSDIYLVRANMNVLLLSRVQDAINDVDKAIALNSWPRVPTDYCVCTIVTTYATSGDTEKAQELAEIAKKVDPGNILLYYDQATIDIANGNLDAALAVLEQGMQIADPQIFYIMIGMAAYHNNQLEDALSFLETAYEKFDLPSPFIYGYLAATYHKLGEISKRDRIMAVMEQKVQDGMPNYSIPRAVVASARGDIDGMLTLIEKAYAETDFALAYFLNVDPAFKAQSELPRMAAIRQELQLQ